MEISCHFEMLLVGKFLSLEIQLTVPSTGRYIFLFSQNERFSHFRITNIMFFLFHPKKGDFSSVL